MTRAATLQELHELGETIIQGVSQETICLATVQLQIAIQICALRELLESNLTNEYGQNLAGSIRSIADAITIKIV